MTELSQGQELDKTSQKERVDKALNTAVENARRAVQEFRNTVSQEISPALLSFEEALQEAPEIIRAGVATVDKVRLQGVIIALENQLQFLSERRTQSEDERSGISSNLRDISLQLHGERIMTRRRDRHPINRAIRKQYLGIQKTILSHQLRGAEKAMLGAIQKQEDQEVGFPKINTLLRGLKAVQDKLYLNEVERVADRIAQAGNEFCDMVLQKTNIAPAVEKAFMQNLVQTIEKDSYLKTEDKNSAITAAQAYMEVRDVRGVIRRENFEELRGIVNRGRNESFQAMKLLTSGDDREIISKVAAHIFFKNTAFLFDEITSLSPFHITELTKKIFDKRAQLQSELVYRYEEGPNKIEDMRHTLQPITPLSLMESQDLLPFHLFKGTPEAQEIFGEEIKSLDSQLYQHILEQSLHDGKSHVDGGFFIEGLTFYPTPQAIKYLTILAAADPSPQSYATRYANKALFNLRRSNDWAQKVEGAIAEIPELKDMESLLLNWKQKGDSRLNFIQNSAGTLALKIYHDSEEPEALRKLARATFPTKDLLKEFVEKGLLAQEVFQRFKALPENQPIEDHLHPAWAYDQKLRRLVQALPLEESGEGGTPQSFKELEAFLLLPESVPVLFSEETSDEMRSLVFKNSQTILKDQTDLTFLNRLIGMHGKKSYELLEGYVECVQAGVIPPQKDIVLEFTRHFKVLKPNIFTGYVQAVENGTAEMYLLELRSFSEKLVSSAPSNPEDREKPYYRDLLEALYANNSGSNWTTFEINDACQDRSQDLAQFSFRPQYEIDILSSGIVQVKEGEELNSEAVEAIKGKILGIASSMELDGFDPGKAQKKFLEDIDRKLGELQEMKVFGELEMERVTSPEEKLFLLMTDTLYGSQNVSLEELKDLFLRFEFAFFDDVRDYIQGTTDRVSAAPNREYALMCELHSFFSDRIKEISRRLVRVGWENEATNALLPGYFSALSEQSRLAERQDELNRMQVSRLGMSDSFIEQIARALKGKTDRSYTKDQVIRLVQKFEEMTSGLTASSSSSSKNRTRAFYGQLRAQREKTRSAAEKLTGESIDPSQFHLGNINLEELAAAQKSIGSGEYNDEQFASYTAQRFLNIFAEEKTILDTELDKFESESGTTRQIVNGYFTKNKESAHARMVGGVCVAGDNPTEEGGPNLWDQENYFQFVLQDPESLRCVGLVLLHHFTDEEGQRVLAASLNPSSTYLYSVDEAGLFEGIMNPLQEFATANNFDKILFSDNKTIRTNRTGGAFEKAMDQRVAAVDQNYGFSEPQTFSFHPQYQMKEMDVVWQRN